MTAWGLASSAAAPRRSRGRWRPCIAAAGAGGAGAPGADTAAGRPASPRLDPGLPRPPAPEPARHDRPGAGAGALDPGRGGRGGAGPQPGPTRGRAASGAAALLAVLDPSVRLEGNTLAVGGRGEGPPRSGR